MPFSRARRAFSVALPAAPAAPALLRIEVSVVVPYSYPVLALLRYADDFAPPNNVSAFVSSIRRGERLVFRMLLRPCFLFTGAAFGCQRR
jgi:hypothetical protein